MHTPASPRVIALCIEVMSPDLLDTLLRQGWMPNLERLRSEGVSSPLQSHTDLSSGSIWPSFFTGVNPGKHGQYFTHMQLASGTYQIVKRYANDVPYPPFWSQLNQHGRSCAVIDVPQTRPAEPFNGVHVVGWGGEYPAWPRSSAPKRLMSDILRRFGSHPLVDQYRVALRPKHAADFARLRSDLLQGAQAKAQLSHWILDQGSYDLFLTVFAESHWAFHLLWDAWDPNHPLHDPQLAPATREIFRALLDTIDQTLGRLRAAQPHADFLVFSLSGMGPNFSGWHLLPEVLDRLGLGPYPGHPSSISHLPKHPRRSDLKQIVQSLLPPRLIEAAKAAIPARLWDRWTRCILHAGTRWHQSRAFCLPNDYSGAIRINLIGREPLGRVSPGAEFDAICREIKEALLELREVQTGQPVVRDVVKTSDLYPGEHAPALPDLLVLWTSNAPVTGVTSPRIGTIRLHSPEQRTGAHRPQGFFAAAGPHIPRPTKLEPVQLLDLAPTILHLLGVPAPSYFDGRVIPEFTRG